MSADTKFKTEYAASGKSKCNKCREAIPEGDLRMGPMVQSDKGDFFYPQWHHYTCFVDSYLPKHAGALASVSDISGLDKLKFDDAKKIRALVPGGGGNNAQQQDPSLVKEELLIAKQNDKVWAWKAKLEALENKELTEMLEHNGQPCKGKIFGGRTNMLDRAADGMTFGVIPKCGVCGGDVVLSHGQYKCTGAVDEFTKCTNIMTEDGVTRGQWQIPDDSDLKESYPFLKSFRFKAVAKANAAVILTASNPKRSREDDDEKTGVVVVAAPGGGILSGVVVGCAGKLSRAQKVIEDLVATHGGVFDKGTHVAVLITSAKDAAARSLQKLNNSVAAGAVVVSEDWLDACITARKALLGAECEPYLLIRGSSDNTGEAQREARKRVSDRNDTIDDAQKQRTALEKEDMTREEFREKPTNNATAVKSTTKKLIVKGSAAVEPESGVADKTHVYERMRGKTKDVFSQTMSRADITTSKNSFYILQLLEDDNGKKWYVFRKWGKLGHDDIGGTKLTEYYTLTGALKEFEKMYLDKTGNRWEERESFVKAYDKFQPIEIDYGTDGALGDTSRPVQDYAGPLDAATQSLVSLLFDIKAMNSALQEMNIDTTKMPLGKLSVKTIQEGFHCLSALQKVIEAGGDATKLVSLSNRFYTFIPHQFSDPATMLLDTVDKLHKMTKLLETLREMEVASKIISSSSTTDGGGVDHPIDIKYKGLNSDLKSVPKKDPRFKMVMDFVANTHAASHTSYSLHLVDLWEVNRHGEAEKFSKWKDFPNRRLLWHGSRMTNWVGILSQGLRIAPPEAPTTGYMFGKGVYFADMVSKSANYCFTTSEANTGIMVLNEVALGNMKRFQAAHYVDGLEAKYQSTFGEGKLGPDPSQSQTMDNGCEIPMGPTKATGVASTTLQYNEFVVYDTSQIRMRYVLRLEFRYKGKCGTFF